MEKNHPLNHLLIIDDDLRLRQLLSHFLRDNGFDISTASSASEARILLKKFQFDLVVLDIMMPGETGLELTKSLREDSFHTPILLLSARGEIESRILGFEFGADEYLPKPFEPKELLLRIQAILRRSQSSPLSLNKREIQIGPFHFDLQKETLRRGDCPIPLTTTEATLLKILVENLGTYLSREDLISLTHLDAGNRTVDVQITRLRKKIEADPKRPKYLQTVRNKGYILWNH
jgi:two-component system phosphate regulon response regulator OmpR